MTPRPIVIVISSISLCSLCLIAAAPAAGPESLTLRQAVERAVHGNVDLQREGIVLRTTEANIVTALGGFDLVLQMDGALSRRLIAPTNVNATYTVTEGPAFDLS